jgi:hypothetical protein
MLAELRVNSRPSAWVCPSPLPCLCCACKRGVNSRTLLDAGLSPWVRPWQPCSYTRVNGVLYSRLPLGVKHAMGVEAVVAVPRCERGVNSRTQSVLGLPD